MDSVCSGSSVDGLRSHIETERHSTSTNKKKEERKEDSFSLTRRCGFALARIEKSVLTLGHSLGRTTNEQARHLLQEKVGGVILRHFSSLFPAPSETEIGSIGIDLASVRREMEQERESVKREMDDKLKLMQVERDIAKKVEEERQKEFSRKMREMEEMKRMNEELISEGRQRREEKKREEKENEERKRNEEEERRRMSKEGAAAIEVFQQDKFTLTGNVFTKTGSSSAHPLLSYSFGGVVVRITFIFRVICAQFDFGLISTALTLTVKTTQSNFMGLKGGAGWYSSSQEVYQYNKSSHGGSACKKGAVG
ncbi:hypothetical protein BLNAU_10075 [Blattamonas nauphoetae]|uniref:Uncharacterized protein n=1 Tax=Blattamonas nauphoetae TaxID=2049346 RepID=A0ABQ9XTY2_9EUKA|nr:hypothetical protein BLNAU_10075 [Blattamonas nauphoetae]